MVFILADAIIINLHHPNGQWCLGVKTLLDALFIKLPSAALFFCTQAAGEHGMRHSLPNARIMIHQPSGGARGQATDIQIQAEEIIKLKKQLNQVCVVIYPVFRLFRRFQPLDSHC